MFGRAAFFVVSFASVTILPCLVLTTDSDTVGLNPELLESSDGRSARTLPEWVRYKLFFHEDKVELYLRRRHVGYNKADVYHVHSDDSFRIRAYNFSDETLSFYQDNATMASFSLKVAANSNATSHDMTGTFYHNGLMLHLEPMGREPRAPGASVSSSPANATHRLRRLSTNVGVVDCLSREEKTLRYMPRYKRTRTLDTSASELLARGQRQHRATGKPIYEIDLMYIADFSFFKRFESSVKSSRPSATIEQVLREIKFYLAHVENQVDLRYRGIDTLDWIITTNLVAIYIETSKSGSFWTETLVEPPSSPSAQPAINASAALDKFTRWINASPSVTNSLPDFDHAALFTGYDLYGQSVPRGGRNYHTIGLAYTSEMCTPYSTSIIEFTGALTEGGTQAHELGHSLGADHDGYGNACRESDHFIMAASSEGTMGNNSNLYRFSTCSIDAFRSYVRSLNSERINCMLNTLPPYDQATWQADMNILPGTYYTVDDQCKQAFGPTYAACAGEEYGRSICATLWCYDTTSSVTELTCYSVGVGGAADGTSCGNRKWCIRGTCVYNSSAPANSDTCPQGDFARDRTVYTNVPYFCSNMPSYFCYDEGVSKRCCKSCSDKVRNNSTSCAFGDKQDNCNQYSLYSCNSANWKTACCQFCEENRLDIANCDWGDYYSNCDTSMCTSEPSRCCQTCYKLSHPSWIPPAARSRPATTASSTTWKTLAATLPMIEKSQTFLSDAHSNVVTFSGSTARNSAFREAVDRHSAATLFLAFYRLLPKAFHWLV